MESNGKILGWLGQELSQSKSVAETLTCDVEVMEIGSNYLSLAIGSPTSSVYRIAMLPVAVERMNRQVSK